MEDKLRRTWFFNVARPVIGHGMFYISTCFMKAEIHAYRYEGLG